MFFWHFVRYGVRVDGDYLHPERQPCCLLLNAWDVPSQTGLGTCSDGKVNPSPPQEEKSQLSVIYFNYLVVLHLTAEWLLRKNNNKLVHLATDRDDSTLVLLGRLSHHSHIRTGGLRVPPHTNHWVHQITINLLKLLAKNYKTEHFMLIVDIFQTI